MRATPGTQQGIILLVTLVFLVILSTLGYTLTSRVAAQRHRDQYIIDYCKARYSCDSAVKYALATLEGLNPQLVSRPNEPDFSDLFALTEEQYQKLIAQILAQQEQLQPSEPNEQKDALKELASIFGLKDTNDANDVNSLAELAGDAQPDPSESVKIRGPYGPVWPLVTEPVKFEIGTAKVTMEIEDENAKYPLGWALLDDEKFRREAEAGFQTFCEWMGLAAEEVEAIREQLKQIGEIRPFKVEFQPVSTTVRAPATTPVPGSPAGATVASARTRLVRKTLPASQQLADQTAYFARLFHSSLLDAEILARPTVVSPTRKESTLKYTDTWGSAKVNVNTAPRHVLEAAFAFGGDADRIADAIIRKRRIKPFENMEELKKELFAYSTSIGKCENFITTTSDFFTIRVTAISGVAKASSVIAIIKQGNNVQRVAVINS